MYAYTDIEQTLTRGNLIYLAYLLPKELENLPPEFRNAFHKDNTFFLFLQLLNVGY